MIGRNLSNVAAAGDYAKPVPGGYVMRIEAVSNNRQKERLEVCLDFTEGEFSGYYKQYSKKFNWWPAKCNKAYTAKALPFMRAFVETLMECNADTTGLVIGDFEDVDETKMVGKLIGVVVGEREYDGGDGLRKTVLDWYNAKFVTIECIRSGQYTIPEKRVEYQTSQANQPQVVDMSAADQTAEQIQVMDMSAVGPLQEDDVPF